MPVSGPAAAHTLTGHFIDEGPPKKQNSNYTSVVCSNGERENLIRDAH